MLIIFYQDEADIIYFENQKFFTPLTSFLPHFFNVGISLNMSFESEIWPNFKAKKVG